MDIQGMMDMISKVARDSRTDYHLTLGKLIEALRSIDGERLVVFDWNKKNPSGADSYRGYYSDLAFGFSDEDITVEELFNLCVDSKNKSFTGYKGGDFVMDVDTPLWAAEYGATGRAIIRISSDDPVMLITREID